MGFIVGIIVFLIVLWALSSLLARGATSRVVRPYIGLLLIALLIACLGVVVGFLFRDLQDFFFTIAKVVAVCVGVALCVHLIIITAKRWLSLR